MGTRSLSELLPTLPLPLEQLGRRVLHGKSAVERHAAAYHLAEAACKLAAAARIGLSLQHGRAPETLRLELLLDATMARWVVLLDEVAQSLAQLPNAALLPLAEGTAALAAPHPEWTAVAALIDEAEQEGAIDAELARQSRQRGLLGAFAVLAARGPAPGAHPEASARLVAAVTELLASPALFGDLQLQRGGDAGRPEQLYFVGPGVQIALHPLVAGRDDGLGRLQVGFLNRTVRRTRKGKSGAVQEVRRIDFLDYASGELFTDAHAEEALRQLFASAGLLDDAATAAGGSRPATRLDEVLEANTVLGDFQLLAELGKGGMGVVYKALQLSVRRIVALKVLPISLGSDPVMLGRFQREIAALQRCDHPNVVKVLTAGSEAGRHFYAMEFVDGADLAQTVRVLAHWAGTAGALREGHLQAALSQSSASARAQPAEDSALAVTAAVASTADSESSQGTGAPPPPITEGRPLEDRLAELFADAASGLAHLHDHGVIHRDIKPANLMLTADAQRIVIMDLGLARLDDESQALTSADIKILGTLRYMPPEQLDRSRDALDHRADLYSLGVSLYELATGHRFFAGSSDEQLIQLIRTEEPAPPLALAPHLNRDLATVLQVATAKQPERRYQSARALEADLRAVAAKQPIRARPPGAGQRLAQWARHHRPTVVAGGAIAVILALNAALYTTWQRQRTQLCRGAAERLAGAWDDKIKEAVRASFRATGKSYAAAALQSVEAALDARATAWAAMHQDACEATRVRGEQSEQLLDRRMSCLSERREELRTLGDVFSHADAAVVERAVGAAQGLTSLAGCADGRALQAQARLPADPKAAAALTAQREELARIGALERAGRYAEGLTRAKAAVSAATQLGDRALLAEAQLLRGKLEYATTDLDAAEKSLYEAWWTAEAGGHDEIKARAASQLVYLIGYVRARHKEALLLDHHVAAVNARLDNNLALEAGRRNHLGAVLRTMGDYDHALVEFEQSLAMKQRLAALAGGSVEEIGIAETLNNLGNVLDDKGEHARALEALGRALEIRQRLLGPDHPDVARTLNNLGVVYANQGDTARAFDHYQRALAIEERVLGPEDPAVAMSLNNLGGLLSSRGDHEAALAHHRRALQIWEKSLGPQHPNVGISINNLGEQLRYQQRWNEALAEYGRALALFHKAIGDDHPAVAMVLCNAGQAHLGKRDYPAAAAALERVFAICDKKTCEPSVISEAAFALAETLWQQGARTRARSFAERARQVYGKIPGSEAKLAEIAAWLSHHG